MDGTTSPALPQPSPSPAPHQASVLQPDDSTATQTNERADSSQGGLEGSEPWLTPKRERSPSTSSTRATPQADGGPLRKRAKMAKWTREEELAFLEVRKSDVDLDWDPLAEKLAARGFPKRSGAALKARWVAKDGSNDSPGLGSERVRPTWSAQEKVDLLAIATRGGACWMPDFRKSSIKWDTWTPFFPGRTKTEVSWKAHDLRQTEEKKLARIGLKPTASQEVQLRWQQLKAAAAISFRHWTPSTPVPAYAIPPPAPTPGPSQPTPIAASTSATSQTVAQDTTAAALTSSSFTTYTAMPQPSPLDAKPLERANPATPPSDSVSSRFISPVFPASSSSLSSLSTQPVDVLDTKHPDIGPLATLTSGDMQPLFDKLVSGLCTHLAKKLDSVQAVNAGDASIGASAILAAGEAGGSGTGTRRTSDGARGQAAAGWGDEEDLSWLPRTERGVALVKRLRGIAARLAA